MSIFYCKNQLQWRMMKHLLVLGIARKDLTVDKITGEWRLEGLPIGKTHGECLDNLRWLADKRIKRNEPG